MPRTHYTAADLERLSCNVKDAETIITFRNEQLLNLFINEMQGQISDGYWENGRNNKWLWSNVIYRLGQETKVEVFSSWHIGSKSFGLPKDLWDIVGYRMWGPKDETTAGYQTEKEARKAWRELAIAIYNAKELPKGDVWYEKKSRAEKEHRDLVAGLEAKADAEKKEACGSEYGGVRLIKDDRNSPYISVEKKIWKGTYYFMIDGIFKVEAGHLKEALDELLEVSKNLKSMRMCDKY